MEPEPQDALQGPRGEEDGEEDRMIGRLTCPGPPQNSGQSCEGGKKMREWRDV